MMRAQYKNKGQIIMEFVWLVIFLSSFLASVLYLYKEGRKEIDQYQLGKRVWHEKTSFPMD